MGGSYLLFKLGYSVSHRHMEACVKSPREHLGSCYTKVVFY